MSMPVRRLVVGWREGEFRFISGGVFHLVKINKICEGGHVKQKVAGSQKKGDHMGSPQRQIYFKYTIRFGRQRPTACCGALFGSAYFKYTIRFDVVSVPEPCLQPVWVEGPTVARTR